MRSLELVNIRTNVRTYVRTYVLTYIRTGQTLYPLHNFVVRGDNQKEKYYQIDTLLIQTEVSSMEIIPGQKLIKKKNTTRSTYS